MGVDNMSSKKTNERNNKKSIAPTVLSALTIAPAIITAIEELMDKFPDVPGKVVIPQLSYDSGPRLKLDEAVMALTNSGLKAIPSELALKEADPKYKDCFDSQVVGSSLKGKQKAQAGMSVIVKYITQEVIDESQRLFEKAEEQKAIEKRVKAEKRELQVEQAQKIIVDVAVSAKDRFGKILPHRKHEITDSNNS